MKLQSTESSLELQHNDTAELLKHWWSSHLSLNLQREIQILIALITCSQELRQGVYQQSGAFVNVLWSRFTTNFHYNAVMLWQIVANVLNVLPGQERQKLGSTGLRLWHCEYSSHLSVCFCPAWSKPARRSAAQSLTVLVGNIDSIEVRVDPSWLLKELHLINT